MRKIFLLLLLIPLFISSEMTAFAFDADIYEEQLEMCGAEELEDKLPEEAAEHLEELGIDYSGGSVSLLGIASEIAEITAKATSEVFAPLGCIIGLIIISAMLGSVCESTKSLTMHSTVSACTGAIMCIIIAMPTAQYISSAAQIIEKCCIFNEAFIPVYSGIMAASGQAATAAGYSTFMLAALEGASFAVSGAVLPLLRAVLALALTSSLSPSLKLGGAIKLFEQYLKWLLGFVAVMTAGIMGIGGAASSAMDAVTSRAAKFIVSSSVPVLGSAMGEALSSVQGCVNVLRASVGSFGIIAMAFILLPALIKGVLWQLCLNLCVIAADMLGVNHIKELADSIGRVVSVMIAIIIFTGVLTIFTLAVMLGKGT